MAYIKIAFFAAMMASASAMPQLYGPPAPSYGPAPIVVEDPIVPPHYNFQYGVSDAETGQQFSHGENRDNYNTAGEYRVNLPDGRIQIVTYKADEAGYVADVRYEGEAVFPAEPVRPAYAPAPVVAAAPVLAPRIVAAPAPILAPRVVAAPAPILAPRVVAAPAPILAPRIVAAPRFAPVAVATPVFRAAQVVPVARTFGFRTLPAEAPVATPNAAAPELEAAPVALEAEAAPAPVEAEAAAVEAAPEAAEITSE